MFKMIPSTINHDKLDEKTIQTSFLQLNNAEGNTQTITMETLLTVRYSISNSSNQKHTHTHTHTHSLSMCVCYRSL